MFENIGMSSRGDEDEKLDGLSDFYHEELHLSDEIVKDPKNKKLQERLKKTIKARQKLQKLIGNNNINPNASCRLKHATIEHRRNQELLSNIIRQDNINQDEIDQVVDIMRDSYILRKNALDDFLSGNGTINDINDDVCMKCVDDLNLNSSEVVVKKEDNSNNRKLLYIALGVVGVYILIKIFSKMGEKEGNNIKTGVANSLIGATIPKLVDKVIK